MQLSRRAWLAALPLVERLAAQEAPFRFSADVGVVNLFATVRDMRGGVVKDLAKDDFEVFEDERRQTIRYFSPESNLPLRLGLVADVSGSMLLHVAKERDACLQFFRQVLRPEQDRAFLVSFDRAIELLQGLTGDVKALAKAAGQLKREPRWDATKPLGRPPGESTQCRSAPSAIKDSVFQACEEILQKERGRKALILLSDGMDGGSCMTLRMVTEAAQRADTIVYTLMFTERRSREYFDRHPGRPLMQQLAARTGGRMFLPGVDGTAAQAFAAIEEDLRNQYSIGYLPETPSLGFHQLRVTAKAYQVQTREGYYGR